MISKLDSVCNSIYILLLQKVEWILGRVQPKYWQYVLLLSRMNHTVGIEYRKKLNSYGKHRSTVNCLARGWKVGISRGKCRWAVVHVSPSNQKGNGVSTFLFFEGTGGTWDRQEVAVCGVSGTEYDCFGTACLETAYNTPILNLIVCVVCGLTLNCY